MGETLAIFEENLAGIRTQLETVKQGKPLGLPDSELEIIKDLAEHKESIIANLKDSISTKQRIINVTHALGEKSIAKEEKEFIKCDELLMEACNIAEELYFNFILPKKTGE